MYLLVVEDDPALADLLRRGGLPVDSDRLVVGDLSYLFTWWDRRPGRWSARTALSRWAAYQGSSATMAVLNMGVFVVARGVLPVLVAAALGTGMAAINPGNSGGALVTLNGDVAGIPTLEATDPESGGAAKGIGFAVPTSRVTYIVHQIIATGHVEHTGRAYLGAATQDTAGQNASPFGYYGGYGPQVAGAKEFSSCAKLTPNVR